MTLLKQSIDLEIQQPHQTRKEVNSILSPLGRVPDRVERQTDMPITHAHQREAPTLPPIIRPN
jgi:hypothetical protein